MDVNLFKRKVRNRKTGELVELDKWCAWVRDLRGKRVRVTLSERVPTSRKAVVALVDAINEIRAGSTVVPDDLPPIVQEPFLRMLEKANHKLGRLRSHVKPLSEHLDDYEAHLADRKRQKKHIKLTRNQIEALADECNWCFLSDINAVQAIKAFEEWRIKKDHSPRTRNAYLTSIRSFINWCRKTDPPRLDHDPLAQVGKVTEEDDLRRKRRALSEDEIQRLIEAALERPLKGFRTIIKGERKGELTDKIKDSTRARLLAFGRQRALQYQTLIMLGLRLNELKKLRWCDVDLGDNPSVTIWGKGQKFESLPIRADLLEELRVWREERVIAKATDLVFDVPGDLIRRLKKDLELAKVPYKDELGRYVDVHALRHTTATMLAKGGANPREAQEYMRHSSLELTMKVYTDPTLLDKGRAAEVLPRLNKRKLGRENASS